ncbi:ABC transporter substrate-binding protein [Virgibacillus phasianinus]|uniref:ABC transporter substrate-binding protein n=1 Tax=Virgibacillus phasianinus TaxID=2017483 RepID=A0A220U336_9BACI|nr:ABC transporter substrate-binding protein [Virgibacillus phasianinus]ASK62568.1 ABC transporter substrate-binding protein [Virgibacillus phasianinus]
MKLWKSALGSLWVIAMVILLVACSNADSTNSKDESKGNDDTSSEADAASDEEVTIVYARGVDTTGANKKLVAAFEKSHPNINVEYREMPADTGQQHDQYVTAFSAQSSEIDVFDADVIWPAEFAQADYALELDRFIKKDGIDMDAYFEGTVASGKFNGKQWAMPKFTDAGVLYYRSDIVEEPPATWDELMEQASSLKGEAGTEFGYIMQAAQYEGLVCNAIEFIASYGGAIIDEENNVVANSPETVKAIKKMKEIVNSDFVPDNILNFMETETETAFIEGKSVFARNWPYMQASAADESRSKVAGNVEITTLPKGDAGNASTLGGWMTMINRYSEHPEAAWEFVKFMTGPEGQKITATEGGSAPTLKALYDDKEVKEASPLFANPEFVKVLESAVPRPVTPIYPKISDIMQIELSKALAGEQTAEETAKNMQTKIESAVSE